ncbi:gun4 domain-containing protein [Leptolyngbya sp. Heron Island J]|uniref:GUN4 domain-containing protein n=1 Tax=Leptolyngbya sp. Heron Island J TaxID=1385935 RepID=UPI0003B9BEF9|nr:GUN4 domain-containing protein [Leptolyngbya sp. Heron Island J]ESA38643.1 gun4 domain-containing protein [Leptolyngbya sp. Heron Island J]
MTSPNSQSDPTAQNPDSTENSPSPELLAIQQMMGELSALRQEVSQLAALPQQVRQIERRLMVVGDLYRYETLHEQLANQQWFAADKETVRLIADIAGVSDLEDLSPREIRSFSCGELQVIDRLWTTYSEGRFGFSIQLKIYQDLGGSLESTIGEDLQLTQRWGAALGWREGVTDQQPEGNRWRKCDGLDFSLNAPKGCHPSRWWNSPYGSRMTNYFLNRLITCEM